MLLEEQIVLNSTPQTLQSLNNAIDVLHKFYAVFDCVKYLNKPVLQGLHGQAWLTSWALSPTEPMLRLG